MKLNLLLKAGFSAESAKLQPKRLGSIAIFPWKNLNSLHTFLFNWQLSHASSSSESAQDGHSSTQLGLMQSQAGGSTAKKERLHPWLSVPVPHFREEDSKMLFPNECSNHLLQERALTTLPVEAVTLCKREFKGEDEERQTEHSSETQW